MGKYWVEHNLNTVTKGVGLFQSLEKMGQEGKTIIIIRDEEKNTLGYPTVNENWIVCTKNESE
jgi:hypothetical protein